jgi:site-specific DNA recombinase
VGKELYQKYTAKYTEELSKINEQIEKSNLSSSNLEIAVEKGLTIAQNLSKLWALADFNTKQKLQYLVFPEGIVYSKENDAVRTLRINSLFSEIPHLRRELEENKKGNSLKNCLLSNSVPGTGFEPAHLAAPPPEDGASTNFATRAGECKYSFPA